MPGRARFFLAGGPGGGSCAAPTEDDTAVVGVASTSILESSLSQKRSEGERRRALIEESPRTELLRA